ncbi:MAG TPA: YebC/PmpR family DNA-binding transcriptional regulator [Candidatus Magasanikbacteria bacterium]|nr:YebC/PmpR family DNA-binding transcriptional regulator [Candidatus Magasanikbacteria bacterium]
MSKHSKWAKVKNQKFAADSKRSAVFTKFIRGIAVAAREGVDPVKNFKLRMAIDSAKAAGVPKDTIDRALARAAGEGEALQEALYEALGPGKVGIMIEVVTNNTNRSVNDLRNLLEDHGGVLGQSGTVAWQFNRLGVVRLATPADEELELKLIDWGAEDIKNEDGGSTIYTQVANFQSVLDGLEKNGFKPEYQALEWVAKESMEVDETTHEKLEKLYEALDEADDVQNYFTSEA